MQRRDFLTRSLALSGAALFGAGTLGAQQATQGDTVAAGQNGTCLLYTSPSPRD